MLDTAIVGEKISKKTYASASEQLRFELLRAQQQLASSRRSVIVVVAGSDALGRHECINLLHEWIDPRGLATHAFDEPTDEERQRPRYWRYWRTLPARGTIGVYANAWTERAIQHHLLGKLDDDGFDVALRHVRRFERMLADDGAVIMKFWIHVTREELAKRRDKAKADPDEHWQFSEDDRLLYRHYTKSQPLVERALRETHTDSGRWLVIDGTERRYRNLAFGRALLDTLKQALVSPTSSSAPRHSTASPTAEQNVLSTVDLTQRLSKDEYSSALSQHQRQLLRLSRHARADRRSTIMVFEGWDAAGKGGCIRRMTAAMDAEHFRVIPIQAPNDEEHSQHYLWRFWRHLPLAGHCAIFDRSWYGRVMVERVEGFCSEAEWQRAYDEINEFEQQMTDSGITLLKFWLHIDADEQLRRFKSREVTLHKQHKITEEDYRNRKRWDDYENAVNEMLVRTSTEYAPWHMVAANDKRHARVNIIDTVCRALRSQHG